MTATHGGWTNDGPRAVDIGPDDTDDVGPDGRTGVANGSIEDAENRTTATVPEVEEPPQTGDPTVDEALARLHDHAETGDLDAQAEAGEAAHQALRDRLADLGGDERA